MSTLDLTKNPFFWYTRIEREEEPSLIEGAPPKEKVTRTKDYFNLSDVIRLVNVEGDILVAIFKDGREEKMPKPVLVKGRMEIQHERVWNYTQIPIEDKDDQERLFALLEQ